MEVVVITGAIRRGGKLQSNHHHQQTNTQYFLPAGCPSCDQCQSTEGKTLDYHLEAGKLFTPHLWIYVWLGGTKFDKIAHLDAAQILSRVTCTHSKETGPWDPYCLIHGCHIGTIGYLAIGKVCSVYQAPDPEAESQGVKKYCDTHQVIWDDVPNVIW